MKTIEKRGSSAAGASSAAGGTDDSCKAHKISIMCVGRNTKGEDCEWNDGCYDDAAAVQHCKTCRSKKSTTGSGGTQVLCTAFIHKNMCDGQSDQCRWDGKHCVRCGAAPLSPCKKTSAAKPSGGGGAPMGPGGGGGGGGATETSQPTAAAGAGATFIAQAGTSNLCNKSGAVLSFQTYGEYPFTVNHHPESTIKDPRPKSQHGGTKSNNKVRRSIIFNLKTIQTKTTMISSKSQH